MSRDIGILGGGLMGLTLAYLQLRRGHRVTLYEREPQVGGLLRSATLDGVRFDRFYHCILPTDGDLLWLLDELGLADRVRWRRTRTGFFHEGKLHSLDGIVDFLRFPPLTLPQRLRLGWTIFRTAHIRDWRSVDHLRVEEYLVRLGGRAVFDRVWRPLLRSKLGEAWRETSAAFIWSTINRLYAARATPQRAEKLGFLTGAYEVVLDQLLRRIADAGGVLRTGEAVQALQRRGDRLQVRRSGGGGEHDAVLSTVPPTVLARLVGGLSPAYAKQLEGFRFLGVRTLVLLLRRPLSPYYVINLTDLQAPITGVVEMGNLAPEGTFGEGRSLVYLPRYGARDSEGFLEEESVFRATCLEYLGRVVPTFTPEEIDAEQVFQAPLVLPIPGLGFGDRLPGTRTPVPGLFFAHNLQIYPRTLHNDAVIETARRVDRELAQVLAS